jgi:hypothetical protein
LIFEKAKQEEERKKREENERREYEMLMKKREAERIQQEQLYKAILEHQKEPTPQNTNTETSSHSLKRAKTETPLLETEIPQV